MHKFPPKKLFPCVADLCDSAGEGGVRVCNKSFLMFQRLSPKGLVDADAEATRGGTRESDGSGDERCFSPAFCMDIEVWHVAVLFGSEVTQHSPAPHFSPLGGPQVCSSSREDPAGLHLSRVTCRSCLAVIKRLCGSDSRPPVNRVHLFLRPLTPAH